MEARYKLNSPPVVLETVDGETILVNLETGVYYDLNHTGGHLLHALGAGAPFDEVSSTLADGYAVDGSEFEDAARALVGELLAEGILKPLDRTAPDPATAPTTPDANKTYEPPKLRKFTDMQELLLLDPVHEVDKAGWPERS